MARKNEVTETELKAFLERLDEISIDAGDLIDRLGMARFTSPADLASSVVSSASTVLELGRKLAILSRHAELRRETESEVRASL